MSAQPRLASTGVRHAFDVPRTPLSIRSLNYRRSAPHASRPVADRVRGEFVEMRGFSPTIDQAARLFDLSADECQLVLGILLQEGFLSRTPDGRYRAR